MYTYYFEKLDVFKRSKELVRDVYYITSEFPNDEKYSIVSQIRRASISVMANLVEGNSRTSKKDQAHFTTMSYSSLMELLSLMIVSFEMDYLNEKDYKKQRSRIDIISIQLNSLKKTQLS